MKYVGCDRGGRWLGNEDEEDKMCYNGCGYQTKHM